MSLFESSSDDQQRTDSDSIKIYIIEDDPVFLKMLVQTLEKTVNYKLAQFNSVKDFMKNLQENPDIVIIDYNLPDANGVELLDKITGYNENIKTIVVSGQQDVEVVVKVYKSGADDYIVKNQNCLPELENSIKNLASNVLLRKEVEMLKSEILDRKKYDQILGNSPSILKVLRLIEKAENSNILVLITGASGTGKELVARAIHYNSPRKKKPFVPVNMAAIPKDLIESELFGHEKGAFTGAIARRIGKFEEANEGTLFLDEIGEMDTSLQAKLLRIIEDKQLVRVGSNSPINLDIRIIVATNRDLYQEMKSNNFREELFYRLQGFLIQLPTLAERTDDILLLAKAFLKDFTESNGMPEMAISKESAQMLLKYNWHGNVRELKSMIERAALLTNDNSISPKDLLMLNVDDSNTEMIEDGMSLEDYKLRIIQLYLSKYDNNIDLVANKLNIGKATVYRTLKKIQPAK